MGVRPPTVAADLALSLPPPVRPPADEVVVCLRPFVPPRATLPVAARRTASATPEWFVDGLARALDAIAVATGLAIHFVSFEARRDGAVHRQVAERMGRDLRFSEPGLDDVLDVVAQGRAVIAMRYHAAIAATLGGRPVVALGYAPKVAALAGDIGAGAALVSLEPQAVASLPDRLASVTGTEDVVIEARERLRQREAANDLVIDRLLDAVRAR